MKKWALRVVCILAILFLAGCDARVRYRTLSFFFDGVPDPDKIAAVANAPGKKGGKQAIPKPRLVNHGPYEAKLCNACHQRATNALVLPVEELCFKCHTIDIKKKHLHGPVAAGGCRICHDPHGTGRPYLLVSEPKKFCYYCHDEKSVAANEVHKGVEAECIECHDAHSSDNPFLLK